MKRALLTQIKNDWRENVWIVVELGVVIAAIWVIITVLYALTQGLFRERGFTPDDVYVMQVRMVQKESPEYVVPDSTAGFYDDRNALLRRLAEHPDVEAVAMSRNAIPYNYNFQGINIQYSDRSDSIDYMANMRYGTPEIVKVLKFKSLTGKDEKMLTESLRRGEILLSNSDTYEEQGRDPKDFLGKIVYIGGDSTRQYKVADLIAQVRRNDYELSWGGTAIVPLDENNDWASHVAVRVKPGYGDSFKQTFLKDKTLQRRRNFYLTDIKSRMDIREANQRDNDTTVRMFVVVMGFLLVTIFLGLLGSFWFRMQQRVSEIAIRKVCGATRVEIFRRIISEGMTLLVFGAVIASACVWPFCHYAGDMLGMSWKEVLIIEFVAIFFVALSIVLSVLYPARRAMSIEPAIAIKDE